MEGEEAHGPVGGAGGGAEGGSVEPQAVSETGGMHDTELEELANLDLDSVGLDLHAKGPGPGLGADEVLELAGSSAGGDGENGHGAGQSVDVAHEGASVDGELQVDKAGPVGNGDAHAGALAGATASGGMESQAPGNIVVDALDTTGGSVSGKGQGSADEDAFEDAVQAAAVAGERKEAAAATDGAEVQSHADEPPEDEPLDGIALGEDFGFDSDHGVEASEAAAIVEEAAAIVEEAAAIVEEAAASQPSDEPFDDVDFGDAPGSELENTGAPPLSSASVDGSDAGVAGIEGQDGGDGEAAADENDDEEEDFGFDSDHGLEASEAAAIIEEAAASQPSDVNFGDAPGSELENTGAPPLSSTSVDGSDAEVAGIEVQDGGDGEAAADKDEEEEDFGFDSDHGVEASEAAAIVEEAAAPQPSDEPFDDVDFGDAPGSELENTGAPPLSSTSVDGSDAEVAGIEVQDGGDGEAAADKDEEEEDFGFDSDHGLEASEAAAIIEEAAASQPSDVNFGDAPGSELENTGTPPLSSASVDGGDAEVAGIEVQDGGDGEAAADENDDDEEDFGFDSDHGVEASEAAAIIEEAAASQPSDVDFGDAPGSELENTGTPPLSSASVDGGDAEVAGIEGQDAGDAGDAEAAADKNEEEEEDFGFDSDHGLEASEAAAIIEEAAATQPSDEPFHDVNFGDAPGSELENTGTPPLSSASVDGGDAEVAGIEVQDGGDGEAAADKDEEEEDFGFDSDHGVEASEAAAIVEEAAAPQPSDEPFDDVDFGDAPGSELENTGAPPLSSASVDGSDAGVAGIEGQDGGDGEAAADENDDEEEDFGFDSDHGLEASEAAAIIEEAAASQPSDVNFGDAPGSELENTGAPPLSSTSVDGSDAEVAGIEVQDGGDGEAAADKDEEEEDFGFDSDYGVDASEAAAIVEEAAATQLSEEPFDDFDSSETFGGQEVAATTDGVEAFPAESGEAEDGVAWEAHDDGVENDDDDDLEFGEFDDSPGPLAATTREGEDGSTNGAAASSDGEFGTFKGEEGAAAAAAEGDVAELDDSFGEFGGFDDPDARRAADEATGDGAIVDNDDDDDDFGDFGEADDAFEADFVQSPAPPVEQDRVLSLLTLPGDALKDAAAKVFSTIPADEIRGEPQPDGAPSLREAMFASPRADSFFGPSGCKQCGALRRFMSRRCLGCGEAFIVGQHTTKGDGDPLASKLGERLGITDKLAETSSVARLLRKGGAEAAGLLLGLPPAEERVPSTRPAKVDVTGSDGADREVGTDQMSSLRFETPTASELDRGASPVTIGSDDLSNEEDGEEDEQDEQPQSVESTPAHPSAGVDESTQGEIGDSATGAGVDDFEDDEFGDFEGESFSEPAGVLQPTALQPTQSVLTSAPMEPRVLEKEQPRDDAVTATDNGGFDFDSDAFFAASAAPAKSTENESTPTEAEVEVPAASSSHAILASLRGKGPLSEEGSELLGALWAKAASDSAQHGGLAELPDLSFMRASGLSIPITASARPSTGSLGALDAPFPAISGNGNGGGGGGGDDDPFSGL